MKVVRYSLKADKNFAFDLFQLLYIKRHKIDVTAYFYGKQKNKQKVIRYNINNLGHALAVDPGENIKQGGTISKYAIDKDFHSTYWAACFFGLVK